MSAIRTQSTTLAIVLVLATQAGGGEASSPMRAFAGAVGELSGFLQQIHRFYSACGERLQEVDFYRAEEQKWKEANTLLVQLNESANARLRASMSPQQLGVVDSVDNAASQATLQALRDLDDEKARNYCSSFRKNMDNPQWVEEWLTPRMNAVLEAGMALNDQESKSK